MYPAEAPPGRRRRGRPPKNRLMGRIPHDRAENQEASDDETRILLSRKRTRSTIATEFEEKEIDEAGEEKIDKDGWLKGGREYKVGTFTLPSRDNKLLIFATEPAKLFGYRDSSMFFDRNPELERVRLDDTEKKWLVKQKILVNRFLSRDVAVVSARSVFRCFGAKIVKRGRRCRDDYFEARAREEGYTDEDPGAGSDDAHPENDGRRSLISRSIRSDGYKAESPVNSVTWMHHSALGVLGFNAQLSERRSGTPVFFDIHTNVNQVATTTQPTHCKFEASKEPASTDDMHFDPSDRRPARLGQELLVDSYQEELLDDLPADLHTSVKAVMRPSSDTSMSDYNDDINYPLALIKGQFQAFVPIDTTRFNAPTPQLLSPSTIQSELAKHYYLRQLEAVTARHQPAQQHILHHPSPPLPNIQPFGNIVPLGSPLMARSPARREHPTCGAVMTGGLTCRQAVAFPGGRCQAHASIGKLAQSPTVDNHCADCHGLNVPENRLSAKTTPVCDVRTMVKCAKCNQRYHPMCAELETPRLVAAVESYPWSCSDCKTCCVCKSVGDEDELLICDGCDRGWHMGCCKPKISDLPKGTWLCALCADCHSCDEHGSGDQFHHAVAPPSDRYKYPVYLATYCKRCFDNFEQDRFCPVCLKTYSETEENDEEDNEMVACDKCDHWVHTKCDETLTPENYQKLCDDEDAKYSCPMCSDNIKPLIPKGNASIALKGLSAPIGYCVGLLGGKVKTRGVVKYKDIQVGVPEINGTGMAEMP